MVEKNPIEQLHKSVNKPIVIKVKRNRIFKGTLKSFDVHLNCLLSDCTYSYKVEDEQKNLKEFNENFDEVLVRGDNIVFITMD
jgi:small nuclear ribonucleoprotein